VSADTWLHRAARVAVRPLVGTAVTPNHLTTLRLATGLASAAAFASGERPWLIAGGALFLASALLDRADGELARLAGASSPFGHRYDLASDAAVTVLVFVAIGAGLGAPALGAIAGGAIAAMFWMVARLEAAGGEEALPGAAGFDPDDALLLVPLCAWVGWLGPLLQLAALVAPLAAVALFLRHRSALARSGR